MHQLWLLAGSVTSVLSTEAKSFRLERLPYRLCSVQYTTYVWVNQQPVLLLTFPCCCVTLTEAPR